MKNKKSAEANDPREDILDVEEVERQKKLEEQEGEKPIRWEPGRGLVRKPRRAI